jgi:hypothetical protein
MSDLKDSEAVGNFWDVAAKLFNFSNKKKLSNAIVRTLNTRPRTSTPDMSTLFLAQMERGLELLRCLMVDLKVGEVESWVGLRPPAIANKPGVDARHPRSRPPVAEVSNAVQNPRYQILTHALCLLGRQIFFPIDCRRKVES